MISISMSVRRIFEQTFFHVLRVVYVSAHGAIVDFSEIYPMILALRIAKQVGR